MIVSRYNRVAQALHWLIVALLVLQFAIAWTMPDIHRDTKPVGLVAWHLSVGTFILLVMLMRFGWRMVGQRPPPPQHLAPPLQLLSRLVHALLYLLLILLPVLGWINASARGYPVWLLGIIPLPALSSPNSSFGHAMGDVHRIVAYVLLGTAGLHILGALYHRFVLRDDLLSRMGIG